jgi:hypothetical protein
MVYLGTVNAEKLTPVMNRDVIVEITEAMIMGENE